MNSNTPWWQDADKSETVSTSNFVTYGDLYDRDTTTHAWHGEQVGDYIELVVKGIAPEFRTQFTKEDEKGGPRIDGEALSGTYDGQPVKPGPTLIWGNSSVAQALEKFVPAPGSTIVILLEAEVPSKKYSNPFKRYKLITRAGAENVINSVPQPVPAGAPTNNGDDAALFGGDEELF